MFRRIDESQGISEFIVWISTTLSAKRGLPMLVGVGFVIVSGLCIFLLFPLLVITKNIEAIWLVFCIPFLLLYIGLLTTFIGLMLATPLGEGYQEK